LKSYETNTKYFGSGFSVSPDSHLIEPGSSLSFENGSTLFY